MKKRFIILALFYPLLLIGNNNSDYIKAMKAAIKDLFHAHEIAEYVVVANTFERIAQAEEDEWHPTYYLALTKILMSTQSREARDIDDYLDQAQSALDRAKAMHKTPNSEIVALQGFIHMLRIPLDAASRGPQYSGLAMLEISRSLEIAPENPRAHYIMAHMQMGTAKFFGNDYTEACQSLKLSIQFFEKQKPSENPLDPSWGYDWATAMTNQCNESP